MNIFQHAAWGWAGRRFQELGGLSTFLISLYVALPPEGKEAVNQVLAGDWQKVSLGAVAGLAIYLFAQIQSYRATTRTQGVADGKLTIPATEADKEVLREVSQQIERKPTVVERVTQTIGLGSSR